ncbi:hypothetical protein BJX76DRAFT_327683, partial [Aspergillus varians]
MRDDPASTLVSQLSCLRLDSESHQLRIFNPIHPIHPSVQLKIGGWLNRLTAPPNDPSSAPATNRVDADGAGTVNVVPLREDDRQSLAARVSPRCTSTLIFSCCAVLSFSSFLPCPAGGCRSAAYLGHQLPSMIPDLTRSKRDSLRSLEEST